MRGHVYVLVLIKSSEGSKAPYEEFLRFGKCKRMLMTGGKLGYVADAGIEDWLTDDIRRSIADS